MLTKLLKHEFRATARIMGPLYLVLLAVALGFNLSARLMDSGNFVLNMLAALIILAYVAAIIGVFVVAFILMLQRFYKNLLGDEGYIMFTLPASVHQHVWSKLIVSAVWFIATGVVVILSAFVAAADVSFFTDLLDVFPKLFEQLNAYYAFNGTAFLLEFLALMLAACMSFSLQFYAALAVGHSFANHKMALSVVFFFVFQFVMQMASGILLISLDNGAIRHLLAAMNFHVTGVAAMHVAMLGLIILSVLYGAVFYIVTTITLKKRLNLE
ncbi:MAG TPA: hypothetical protein H9787_11050 [Candidatus Oscillibacter excrementigallinarum]|uniref:Uncharacterized protein n=1 Tax=Candidatus Oscillibacter excrementigallinarum TaxID=2838716 RepID=A0A9D2LKH5_9FIRM|nr:hypothetical protein [Candidatus Oscillibacter excrementigallinarum]